MVIPWGITLWSSQIGSRITAEAQLHTPSFVPIVQWLTQGQPRLPIRQGQLNRRDGQQTAGSCSHDPQIDTLLTLIRQILEENSCKPFFFLHLTNLKSNKASRGAVLSRKVCPGFQDRGQYSTFGGYIHSLRRVFTIFVS